MPSGYNFRSGREKDGRERVVLQASSAGTSMRMRGYRWQPDKGATSTYDGIVFGNDIELQAGYVWISDVSPGDKFDIQVVIPTGHAHNPSGPDFVAMTYAQDIYVPSDGHFYIEGNGTDPFPAGYVLRIVYESTAGALEPAPEVVAHVKYHE